MILTNWRDDTLRCSSAGLGRAAERGGEELRRSHREIYSDLAETPLAHVSTIHSFLWTVIKPFQNDIRAWVVDDIRRIIEKRLFTPARRSP